MLVLVYSTNITESGQSIENRRIPMKTITESNNIEENRKCKTAHYQVILRKRKNKARNLTVMFPMKMNQPAAENPNFEDLTLRSSRNRSVYNSQFSSGTPQYQNPLFSPTAP